MRQLIQILSQILPIVFGRSIELVTPHESVDERCPAEHFFGIGGSGLMVVDSIAQAIRGLLEILHGLVDLFFRSAAIDRVAVNRSSELVAAPPGPYCRSRARARRPGRQLVIISSQLIPFPFLNTRQMPVRDL